MTNGFSARDEWVFGKIRDVIEDKQYLIKFEIFKMLNKSLKMFKYNNLPDTIPKKDLELQLQVGGHSVITEVNGDLYAFRSGLGGVPNPYYLPTIATVANPALNFSKNLKIGDECVVVLNDFNYAGLMPLYAKYAELLVEAELSLKYAIRNARIPALFEADNDTTRATAEEFFKKIVNGEGYGIVLTKQGFEGLKSFDFYKQDYIKNLIESIQYIRGTWYNEIGVNSQFNMKREAINESESQINEDILRPTIDAMLECRQKGFDEVNKKYGTNISVEFDSIWATNEIENELAIDSEEAAIDNLEAEAEKFEAEAENIENGGEENEDSGNADEPREDTDS